jgi:hypothetical protein
MLDCGKQVAFHWSVLSLPFNECGTVEMISHHDERHDEYPTGGFKKKKGEL